MPTTPLSDLRDKRGNMPSRSHPQQLKASAILHGHKQCHASTHLALSCPLSQVCWKSVAAIHEAPDSSDRASFYKEECHRVAIALPTCPG